MCERSYLVGGCMRGTDEIWRVMKSLCFVSVCWDIFLFVLHSHAILFFTLDHSRVSIFSLVFFVLRAPACRHDVLFSCDAVPQYPFSFSFLEKMLQLDF